MDTCHLDTCRLRFAAFVLLVVPALLPAGASGRRMSPQAGAQQAPGQAPAKQAATKPPATKQGEAMHDASGTFEVKLALTGHNPDASIESRSIDKTFTGGLEAASAGEMLSAGDPATGNAGYVAIERVTGKLDGRVGSFALMHTATMSTGMTPQMQVSVVPGSGTGDLSGIYGTMTIAIAASGQHSYTFRYAFATK